MRENRIHNVPRTPNSNILTTFIANNQKYYSQCEKVSNNSTNLRYYYDYLWSNYQNMKKLDKVLIDMKNIKAQPTMDIYLNNLNTCEFHYKREQYKSKFITILKLLDKEYKHIFNKLFSEFNFTEEEKKDILVFLQNIQNNSLTEEQVIEWVNRKGVKLSRSIYIYMLEGKLPSDITKFFGQNSEIYGEFTSIDIQKDI